MLYTEKGVTYNVDYSFYPADETAAAESIVIESIFDMAGRDVSRTLPTLTQYRISKACRRDVDNEVRLGYERLEEAARARRNATRQAQAGPQTRSRRRPRPQPRVVEFSRG